MLVESERLGRDDRGDHDDEGGGQPRCQVPGRDHQQQGHEANGQCRRAQIADLATQFDELGQRVAGVDIDPGQLAELADDQHHGDAVDVAHKHGSGEVVGQPAEPQQPRDQEARRYQQRQRARQFQGLRAAGGGERQHGRRHERGQRALRADDQLPR